MLLWIIFCRRRQIVLPLLQCNKKRMSGGVWAVERAGARNLHCPGRWPPVPAIGKLWWRELRPSADTASLLHRPLDTSPLPHFLWVTTIWKGSRCLISDFTSMHAQASLREGCGAVFSSTPTPTSNCGYVPAAAKRRIQGWACCCRTTARRAGPRSVRPPLTPRGSLKWVTCIFDFPGFNFFRQIGLLVI